MKHLIFIFTLFIHNTVAIISGGDANQTPYQVSIQVNETHHCGGTIIAPNYILTAAHCIDSRVSLNQLSILAGTNSLSTGGVRAFPAQLIPHEKHKETFPYIYDIALIKLKSGLNFSDSIASIELHQSEPLYGSILQFTGWGWTSLSGSKPDLLQTVNLTSIHPAECKNQYDIDGGPGQVCTISPRGSGPCVNDAGGPVTYQGKLFGIDSYGNSENCDGEKPDITSSVPFHYGWIMEAVQRN